MSIWARLGGTIGSGLGQGVSAGLEQVAERRTKELARKQFIKDVTSEGMFTPEEAGLLLSFPEKDRFEAAQFLAARNNQYEQPRPQPTFQDLVDQERGMGQEQQRQPPDLKSLFSPQMTQKVLHQPASQLVQSPNTANAQQEIPPQLKQVTEQLEQAVAQKQQESPREKLGSRGRIGIGNEGRLEAKEQRITSQDARKFSDPYLKRAEAAKANIRDYDTLIRQAESGKLRAGPKHQILSKLGFGEFNQNFETQIANKLSARLAQNAVAAFGSGTRITNYLEQTFQRSLPSLWNTPQGIVAISKMNKYADEAQILKADIAAKILRENRGAVPYDAAFQIEERSAAGIRRLEQKALSALISAKFPPARGRSKDTVAEFDGNRFGIEDGEWALLPEGPENG